MENFEGGRVVCRSLTSGGVIITDQKGLNLIESLWGPHLLVGIITGVSLVRTVMPVVRGKIYYLSISPSLSYICHDNEVPSHQAGIH